MAQTHKPDLKRFLDRLTSRSILSDQEQQAILDLPTYTVQVDAHRDYVRLNETVEHACLIVDGIMGRFGQTSEGERQITAIHIAGDMADLHSVVQPQGTSALQALSTTTIFRIPHKAVREVAASFPAVAEALWRDCMVDASVLSQWVVNVGRRDAVTRTAHLLCEMATRYRAVQGGQATFPFPVTQNHIADATGMTPVHVNRTLKQLRDQGVATVSHRTVTIHDWNALVTMGEFDPAYLQVDTRPEQRLRIVDSASAADPQLVNDGASRLARAARSS